MLNGRCVRPLGESSGPQKNTRRYTLLDGTWGKFTFNIVTHVVKISNLLPMLLQYEIKLNYLKYLTTNIHNSHKPPESLYNITSVSQLFVSHLFVLKYVIDKYTYQTLVCRWRNQSFRTFSNKAYSMSPWKFVFYKYKTETVRSVSCLL